MCLLMSSIWISPTNLLKNVYTPVEVIKGRGRESNGWHSYDNTGSS